MKRSSRRVLPAAASSVTLAGVLALSACGSSGGPASTGSGKSEAPSTVTIAYITGNDALPDTIAQGNHYFDSVDRQFHTNVVFKTYDSPVPVIAGLISGQIQFGILTEQNGLSSAAQGKPITDVVNLAQGFQGVVIGKASNKTSRGTGLAGLKSYGHATVAVTALQSISVVAVSLLMKLAGIAPANLQFVATGVTGLIPAVASGRADLAFVGTGPAAAAVAAGQTYNVVFSSGPLAYQAAGFIPGFGLQGLPSFIDKYPALTQAIVDAEMKGLAYLKQNVGNPAKVYDGLTAAYQASLPLSSFEAQWSLASGISTPVTGLLTQSEVDNNAKLIEQHHIVPAGFTPPSSMLNITFVDQYYKSTGQPTPTAAIDQQLINQVPDN
jgi:ABC-type nitrate/sulfonate/bicarbonate transport system substrate-binding protein